MKTTKGLVPLRNFAKIGINAYRSAQPMYDYEYNWLKNVLGLKTIINLRSELNHDNKFAPKHGINTITINVKDHKAPTLNEVNDFIKIISNKDNYPLLFHCEHGQGRTSTFSVIYSIIVKNRNLNKALEHEKVKYGFVFKHQTQLDFLSQVVWNEMLNSK